MKENNICVLSPNPSFPSFYPFISFIISFFFFSWFGKMLWETLAQIHCRNISSHSCQMWANREWGRSVTMYKLHGVESGLGHSLLTPYFDSHVSWEDNSQKWWARKNKAHHAAVGMMWLYLLIYLHRSVSKLGSSH